MKDKDRQRRRILVILLCVLACTIWISKGIYEAPLALRDGMSDSSTAISVPSIALPDIGGLESQIIRDIEDGSILVGRNPFEYGLQSVPFDPETNSSMEPEVSTILPSAMSNLVMEPLPPSKGIPFEYNGYALIDEQLRAFLFSEDQLFSVSENDVLMGRYLVNEVTQKFVDIEDLEFGWRSKIPLIAQ